MVRFIFVSYFSTRCLIFSHDKLEIIVVHIIKVFLINPITVAFPICDPNDTLLFQLFFLCKYNS